MLVSVSADVRRWGLRQVVRMHTEASETIQVVDGYGSTIYAPARRTGCKQCPADGEPCPNLAKARAELHAVGVTPPAGKQHQADEHDAAVRRIVEQAHEGDDDPWDVQPKPHTASDRSLLARWAEDPHSDLEEIAPGVYRGALPEEPACGKGEACDHGGWISGAC